MHRIRHMGCAGNAHRPIVDILHVDGKPNRIRAITTLTDVADMGWKSKTRFACTMEPVYVASCFRTACAEYALTSLLRERIVGAWKAHTFLNMHHGEKFVFYAILYHEQHSYT
jgi:hypothetical protein